MAEFESLLARFQVLKSWKNVLVVLATILMSVVKTVLIVLLEHLPAIPVDWYIYRQVIEDIWHPFRMKVVFNPPWTYWFLWPLLKVPVYHVGLIRLLIMMAIIAIVFKRGGRWSELLAILTSLPFVDLVANGNIDWLVGLAFLISSSPQAGWKNYSASLVLLTIKPQVGILAALAWLRKSGWRILLPTVGLFLLSLLVYGWWPTQAFTNILDMRGKGLKYVSWNVSIFPWGVPLGLWLVWKTWQEADEFYGVSATLLLSPYYSPCTLAIWYALALTRFNKTVLGRFGLVVFWLGTWALYS